MFYLFPTNCHHITPLPTHKGHSSPQLSFYPVETVRKGGTPYNDLYGEAPPERGIFFRLQVYEMVGISLIKVYERVQKSVISVYKKAQTG